MDQMYLVLHRASIVHSDGPWQVVQFASQFKNRFSFAGCSIRLGHESPKQWNTFASVLIALRVTPNP